MTGPGLATTLVRDLTDRIVEGRLAPGDRLPTEAMLGEEYGVSRTVVREALSRLQAAGLVETQRGKGSYVLTPPGVLEAGGPAVRTRADLLSVLELRVAIESETAALAARRRSDTDLRRIETALDRFAEAGDRPSEALQADLNLHRAIALAAGSRHLLAVLDGLGPAMIVMPRSRLISDDPAIRAQRHTVVLAEHEEVVTAVSEGDPDLARAALRVHLASSRRRLLTGDFR